MSEIDAQKPKENPLNNILVNVLLPILILSYFSKDPSMLPADKVRVWHIGPTKALMVALALPVCYGIWFYWKHRQTNFFSFMGIGSVILTGGLTLLLWNTDGTVNPSAPLLFGLKEASVPLILGLAVFISHWTKTPLLNTFLYNDQIFDLKKIESRIGEKIEPYRKLLFTCTIIFAASFLISTVLNFFLAQYFLGGGKIAFDSPSAREQYNAAIAKLTVWGFVVIGVPIMGMLFFCMLYLLKGLRKITGLENDEIFLPR